MILETFKVYGRQADISVTWSPYKRYRIELTRTGKTRVSRREAFAKSLTAAIVVARQWVRTK